MPSHRFPRDLPGGLPDTAVETFDWIKHLDILYSAGQIDPFFLREILCIVQMQLIAMPPWKEIDPPIKRQGSFRAIYEVCRITTIMYSNAVLMSTGFNSPWASKYLEELHGVLEMSSLALWEGGQAVPMLVWSLFVGTMVSWFTPWKSTFSGMLRDTIRDSGLENWQQVEQIVQSFLWTDCACGHGARIVWSTLQDELDVRS